MDHGVVYMAHGLVLVLTEYGESLDKSYSTRMVNFLLVNQNKNGGWGEDFSSCYNKAYAINGAELYGDEEAVRLYRHHGLY